MKEFIWKALSGNQLASGGIVLMAMGSVIALLRNLPGRIIAWVKHQSTISVIVRDSDPMFEWISLWLSDLPYARKTRWLIATSKEENIENYRIRSLPRIIFSPGDGLHFFRHEGRFIWLTRADDSAGGKQSGGPGLQTASRPSGPDGGSLFPKREHYEFVTLGRSQSVIRDLLENVVKLTQKERAEKIGIYTSTGYGDWVKLTTCIPRPLGSVILPQGAREQLVNDMLRFLGDRDWYERRGVPYRRGYLFFGPPGNGKTSSIAAIAGELKLNLYSLNLRDVNDAQLGSLARDLRPRSVLLLEDADAALPNREAETNKSDAKGCTLSGVLNVLDGINSPDALLVIMTTNYIDRLDPALIRPGRIDFRMEFKAGSRDQMIRSFLWFYPARGQAAAEEFADSLSPGMSMAAVQEALMVQKEAVDLKYVA
jgi:mitochondrial chaperone BCS1